ncbi:MAG: methionine--tRNA ligase [Spartobacteria bacterium]|nr:methionine--tRNA ligase [Spartobacteria bacterium]
MEKNSFYVTTPIYYVNDKPHIGHSYTTVLADVLARYHRMLQHPTFFLTGTDEHGQKVEKAAKLANMTAQEQADTTVVRFTELWNRLDITYDDFIRTTEERHKKVVQSILQDLYDRGEIYRDEYDGWYCTPCERFFTEKDLEDGCCPECKREVEQIREANYFFRMSRYQEWLIAYIEGHPDFIQPSFRRNETLGFLRRPLNDLCISRPKSRLSWGIELPFDKDFVTYVWFDALVNYISAVGYDSDDDQFKKWWPASIHLIGKDILTTHTVYWPTMLKAIGLPMPRTVFAHGWWMSGESKMSKSLGNVVNPMDMIDLHGVDAFRYFLSAEMTLGQDASFTQESFTKRYNSDLANDFGNLVSRLSKMVNTYCDGMMPDGAGSGPAGEDEQEVWDAAQLAVREMESGVQEMRMDSGIGSVLAAVRAINRYLEKRQPWTQAKAEDKQPLIITLYTAWECLRVASALLSPVMPEKMATVRRALNLKSVDPDFSKISQWGLLPANVKLGDVGVLFPRIVTTAKKEDKSAAPAKKKNKPVEAKKDVPEGVKLITYDDFSEIKLKTARILEAEKVEGADKLLKLQIEVGEEKRQLVAGIAKFYQPQDLIGKMIVIVANLKPARIRGVESQGMLLAANTAEGLSLITVDGDQVVSGAEVR